MKRKLLITVFSSLALVMGVLVAEDAPNKKPGNGGKRLAPAQRAAKMIEKGDQDGDGKLDVTELTAVFQAMANHPGGKRPNPEKKPKAN